MIQRLYALIPNKWREILSPFLSGFYLPVHQMENSTGNIEDRVIVVYLGINEKRARLWGKRVLGNDFVQTQSNRFWVWSLEKQLNKAVPECNVVMVETNWLTEIFLARYKGFKMPMWVQYCLDLTRPLKELKNASTKLREQIPRKIRQHSLELEISRSTDDLEEFIKTMHIPYITGRHQDTAFLTNKDDIRNVFHHSDLLFIKQSGERISGVLLESMENTATLHYLGLKNNDSKYLSMGGVGALYYFSILHAIERGYPTFNMGGTNPFLSDGVAFFKLSFKPFVTRTSYLDDYFIKFILRKPAPGLSNFLKTNPFLYLRKGNVFDRIIFIENSEINKTELNSLLRKTYCEKLNKTVFALKDEKDASQLLEKIDNPQEIDLEFRNWDSFFYTN